MLYKRRFLFWISLYSFCLVANVYSKDDHWDGKRYVNNSGLQYQWATSYIQKFQFSGNERVLDIGCGDGRVTAIIAEGLPDGYVLGIDTSESMLQSALNVKKNIRLDNLDFTKQDAMSLRVTNEFDFIVSFSCFHWIPDHFAALQGIEKALKPGGKVFLYFAADYGTDRIDHAINAVVTSPKWAHYFTNFSNPCFLVTPEKFVNDAEAAGLLLKRLENVIVDEIFPSKAAFAAWMKGWMLYLKLLPEELQQEFLDEIVDCYVNKHPLDDDNKLHYIGYWIEVEFIKPSK